jgi:DNA-binding XRE family transcriptional regulator
MSDRSSLISKLLTNRDSRAAYIRAKLEVLIPSQLRALRLRQERTQPELAQLADMKQSRISAMETPGKVNFNLDTLVRMAATLNVGMMVKFIPFSEMLGWENDYSQDIFDVTQLSYDADFLQPVATIVRRRARRNRSSRRVPSAGTINIPVLLSGVGATTNMVPVQRERVQMKLQFERGEPLPAQVRLADVITLPNPGSILNDLPMQRVAAAAAGAGGNYGNNR